MKIQTMSIVVGDKKCNAHCPFCVSKMTTSKPLVDNLFSDSFTSNDKYIRNFKKACELAKQSGVTTALITGKGEPTLFMDQIHDVLSRLKDFNFPFIELQTNGLLLDKDSIFIGVRPIKTNNILDSWYEAGLTTIMISIVHYNENMNKGIYTPFSLKYIDLPSLIKKIHSSGLSVRLSCIGIDGYIDSPEEIQNLINFAKENNVEQISYREVTAPENSENIEISKWVEEHKISEDKKNKIKEFLNTNGVELLKLVHGGIVYDIDGQNFCYTNCLTHSSNEEEIRQIIYYPNGHLYYNWTNSGAILL